MVFVSSKAVALGTERPPAFEAARLDVERDIELVLAFLNTCDAEQRTDTLNDPELWRQWCAERGWSSAPGVESVREIRDGMRVAVTCGAEPDAEVQATWPLEVRLRGGVPTLGGTDALGAVLAAAVHLVNTGHWDRIKICPAEDCLWAFYDRSRNRSRTWCSMRVCGNREKARSWRERHTTA
jgi:hypothetical protein